MFSIVLVLLILGWLLSGTSKRKSPIKPLAPKPTPPKESSPVINPVDPRIIARFNNWKEETISEILEASSVQSIIRSNSILQIGYSQLLNSIEWKYKRINILVRDGYKCQVCSQNSFRLHVHHKCYIKNELPWEINDSQLMSVCYKCHKEIHNSTQIPVYEIDWKGNMLLSSNHNIYCGRCAGAGWFPQYKHVEDGVCFQCRGNCISSTIFSSALQSNKLRNEMYEDDLLKSIIAYFDSLSVETFKEKVHPLYEEFDDLPF
jgi:hypothetical protein